MEHLPFDSKTSTPRSTLTDEQFETFRHTIAHLMAKERERNNPKRAIGTQGLIAHLTNEHAVLEEERAS